MSAFWKATFKFVFFVGVVALAVGGIFRLFFVDMIIVGHNGMAPTLIYGEEVLLWRGAEDPELGDILVCQHPTDSRMVMARVVGKGGTTIDSNRGRLRISGQIPDVDVEDPVRFFDIDTNREHVFWTGLEQLGNTDHRFFSKEGFQLRIRETTVDAGHVYLLSDNRSATQHDSRTFGDIDPANCIGSLFMRWKPVDDGGANLGHGWLDILD